MNLKLTIIIYLSFAEGITKMRPADLVEDTHIYTHIPSKQNKSCENPVFVSLFNSSVHLCFY